MNRPGYHWPGAVSTGRAVDWSLVEDDPPTVVLRPLAARTYPNASRSHTGKWRWLVQLTDLNPQTGREETQNVATTWTRTGARLAGERALKQYERQGREGSVDGRSRIKRWFLTEG